DLLAQLKILDGHIAGRHWFALDRFTIADIALGSIVKRCLEFPIERPAYSELERWQAAIDARPAFAVAIGAKASVLTPAAGGARNGRPIARKIADGVLLVEGVGDAPSPRSNRSNERLRSARRAFLPTRDSTNMTNGMYVVQKIIRNGIFFTAHET